MRLSPSPQGLCIDRVGGWLAEVVAPGWAELDADPCAEAAGRLWDRVQPGALAASSHHEEIAVTDLQAQSRTSGLRPQCERSDGAQREDRDHRVLRALTRDAVSVPGDAVVAVAVQAEPGTDKWPTELFAVVGVERRSGVIENRMGEW